MPKNTFRPFSLKDAFSAEPNTNTPDELMIDSSTNSVVITPQVQQRTEEILITVSEEEPSTLIPIHHGCGCSRCMGRNRVVSVSMEDIDKKLNWILTLVVFMFMLLIIHIRSQTKTK